MPRRANDPSLLQAQATSGHEGERAYKVEQRQLQDQRQQAVQQAMREAALRGAPPAAIAQLERQAAQPYDQAIRQAGQEGARYTSQLAAGNQRAYDYGQAVRDARELIPAQVQAAVAPIRAQNRFQLQSIRLEGANRVAEIERQTQLIEAQMAASAAAERQRRAREGAANAPTLTQSELAAALETGGADYLSRAQGLAQQIVERNRATVNEDPRFAQSNIFGFGSSMEHPEYPRMDPNVVTPAAAAQQQFGFGYSPQLTPPQAPDSFGFGMARNPAGDTAATPDSFGFGMDRDRQFTYGRSAPGTPALAAPPAAAAPDFSSAGPGPTLPEMLAPNYNATTGYLTPQNLTRLSHRFGDVIGPIAGYAANQDPISGAREVAEVMGGNPTVGGEFRPEATETFRQAMELAASRLLKQGYNVNGAEVNLGINSNQGQTLANYEALQRGELPLAEQIANAREAQAKYEADAAQAQADADEQAGKQEMADRQEIQDLIRSIPDQINTTMAADDKARADADKINADTDKIAAQAEQDRKINEIYTASTINYSASLGPLDAVYSVVIDPASGYQAAAAVIQQWMTENDDVDLDHALDEADFEAAGLPKDLKYDPLLRKLLKAQFG